MPFHFKEASINSVMIIERNIFSDERGYFTEAFKKSDFKEHGIDFDFPQDNASFSKKGVIRGLHYQKGSNAQGKLVSVISGRIYDVAVDLRPESASYGKHVGEILSLDSGKMLWVPAGFAHGFQALEDSVVYYKVTTEYAPGTEGGIIWNDPDIGVKWPISDPILSLKDRSWPSLSSITGF